MNGIANNLKLSDIKEGMIYSFEKTINREDMRVFARLTGDFNPLHMDKDFGLASKFQDNVAHGMLASSFFSTLIGMYCPGKNALYLSQTLDFKKPIFPGDTLLVKGTVSEISQSTGMVSIKTEILVSGKIVISGIAKALVLGDKKDE